MASEMTAYRRQPAFREASDRAVFDQTCTPIVLEGLIVWSKHFGSQSTFDIRMIMKLFANQRASNALLWVFRKSDNRKPSGVTNSWGFGSGTVAIQTRVPANRCSFRSSLSDATARPANNLANLTFTILNRTASSRARAARLSASVISFSCWSRILSTISSALFPYHNLSASTPRTTMATEKIISRCLDGRCRLSQIKFFLIRHLRDWVCSFGAHKEQAYGRSCQISNRNSAIRAAIRILLPLSRHRRDAASASSCGSTFTEYTWTADDYKRRDRIEDRVFLFIIVAF